MVYENFAFSTPFLCGYKLLKIPIIDTCGNPAWPELFPIEKIEQMRETVGHRHFSAQMMLEFLSPERARLDPGALHFYDDEFEPRNATIGTSHITGSVLYWDPSSGRAHRDGSACVLLYRDDKSRHIFIHDILYLTVSDDEQFPLSRQCDMVLDFMRARNLHKITIETNGIGGGLPEIMRDCASRRVTNIYVNRVSNTRAKADRILDAIEPVLTSHITGSVLYWDPSSGRAHRDGSACVLLYRDDKSRHIFIHDILYLTVSDDEQFPLSRQCDMVLDFMRARNLHKITIETNGIGGGLPEIMRDCASRRVTNIYVNRVSNTRAKADRILDAIEPVLSTGRLHAHTRVQNTPLLSEMLGWSPLARGMHDDGLDAVAGAIAQVPTPTRPIGGTIKTFTANTNFKL